jgi:hypothetical protein
MSPNLFSKVHTIKLFIKVTGHFGNKICLSLLAPFTLTNLRALSVLLMQSQCALIVLIVQSLCALCRLLVGSWWAFGGLLVGS